MTDKKILRLIYIVSAIVFVLVAVLFTLPKANHIPDWVKILPKLNASLNGTCFVLLLFSLYFIKQKKIRLHKIINLTAFTLSVLFLLSYVLFHAFGVETRYGDLNHDGVLDAAEMLQAGNIRYVYYVILITHILLAAIVLPLVLISFFRGLSNQIPQHKKIVHWSYPIWLFVTLSGVIVYLMISPYYNF
ncbi:MAG TPA: DUF420 domain-containing protein [Bacteroidia bacterium]|nr:DUF420 domain-containing protein [Bacteroidia bacterium]